jgi:hypothetical protein
VGWRSHHGFGFTGLVNEPNSIEFTDLLKKNISYLQISMFLGNELGDR